MLQNIEILLGDPEETIKAKPWPVFDDRVVAFLNDIAETVLRDTAYRQYKDLMAIAFFFRKSSLQKIKQQYIKANRMGVGLAFQITPSNVAILFFLS